MLQIPEATALPPSISLFSTRKDSWDANDWTRSFTEQRAEQASINLTDQHWVLIDLIRDKYLRLGGLPLMRTVARRSDLSGRN